MKNLVFIASTLFLLASCVSKKDFAAMEASRDDARGQLERTKTNLDDCNEDLTGTQQNLKNTQDDLVRANTLLENEQARNLQLQDELEYFKATNTNLLDRLSDLSIVSKTGAESIKSSLDQLNRQSEYIQDLNTSLQRKDSLNLALVMKLKRSLDDVSDEDVQIEVKKGVVYISISDKMLFRSGSAQITPRAEEVLGKIAQVVNDHNQFDILVEGHTDNVPIATDCVQDNWDLSVKRATSVVRTLQTKYNVSPARMTAGGRGEFLPKADNDSASGRSMNRRTEIIVLPKLDEFFNLLAAPAEGGQ